MNQNIQIPNVVQVAAELVGADVPPGMAAVLATKLCAKGRQFKRLSEKLCGGEEEWGPWTDKVAKLQERAHERLLQLRQQCQRLLDDELTSYKAYAKVEAQDLVLVVHIRPKRRNWPDTITALL